MAGKAAISTRTEFVNVRQRITSHPPTEIRRQRPLVCILLDYLYLKKAQILAHTEVPRVSSVSELRTVSWKYTKRREPSEKPLSSLMSDIM